MDDSRQHDSENGAALPVRPVSVRRIRETELERRAVQIGAVAGHAYAVLREVRNLLEEPGHGSARERLHDLGAAAKAHTDEFRRAAAARAQEWRRTAWENTAELRAEALRRFHEARQRAKRAGEEYPLHIVVGAGIAGFLIGAAMRARRHRDR